MTEAPWKLLCCPGSGLRPPPGPGAGGPGPVGRPGDRLRGPQQSSVLLTRDAAGRASGPALHAEGAAPPPPPGTRRPSGEPAALCVCTALFLSGLSEAGSHRSKSRFWNQQYFFNWRLIKITGKG